VKRELLKAMIADAARIVSVPRPRPPQATAADGPARRAWSSATVQPPYLILVGWSAAPALTQAVAWAAAFCDAGKYAELERELPGHRQSPAGRHVAEALHMSRQARRRHADRCRDHEGRGCAGRS
jgi:hypothetical protein